MVYFTYIVIYPVYILYIYFCYWNNCYKDFKQANHAPLWDGQVVHHFTTIIFSFLECVLFRFFVLGFIYNTQQ